jgi:hypothetical protein
MPPHDQTFLEKIGFSNWDFGPPAVIAALVGAAVALLVMIGNAVANWILHRSKLKFDRQLARERFEFEKSLAERKIALDRAHHIWKRDSEFAEEALSAFYDARSRIQAIRSPGSFNSENNDRAGRENEQEEIRTARDTYYPYVRRIREHSTFFSEFYAKRFRAAALFGLEADQPFREIWSLLIHLKVSAESLVAVAGQPAHHQRQRDRHQRLEETIWEGAADLDRIAGQLDAAIASAEQLLRPRIMNVPDGPIFQGDEPGKL